MRGFTELITAVRNKELTVNGLNTVEVEFPIGGYYRAVHLILKTTLDVGTGSGPIVNGEQNILRNVSLQTANNDSLVKSMPGRGLFLLGASDIKKLPNHDNIAAADGVYEVHFPIYMSNPNALRPDDTALKTNRYSTIRLDLTSGGVADLLSTVGDSAATLTLDVIVERFLDDEKSTGLIANAIREFSNLSPVNPANQQFFDLERAKNFSLSRIVLHAANSATSGKAYNGTPSNLPLDIVNLEMGGTMNKFIYNNLNFSSLQKISHDWYQLESETGVAYMDMSRGGSIIENIFTGEASLFRINWTNGTLDTSQISGSIIGIRTLNK